jgi:hypothetical protein
VLDNATRILNVNRIFAHYSESVPYATASLIEK